MHMLICMRSCVRAGGLLRDGRRGGGAHHLSRWLRRQLRLFRLPQVSLEPPSFPPSLPPSLPMSLSRALSTSLSFAFYLWSLSLPFPLRSLLSASLSLSYRVANFLFLPARRKLIRDKKARKLEKEKQKFLRKRAARTANDSPFVADPDQGEESFG